MIIQTTIKRVVNFGTQYLVKTEVDISDFATGGGLSRGGNQSW